jgi:hypothetical protein
MIEIRMGGFLISDSLKVTYATPRHVGDWS